MRMAIKKLLRWIAMKIGTGTVLRLLEQWLTKETIVDFIDGILDYLEEMAAETPTPIDDAILRIIRDTLDIPDGDDTQKRPFGEDGAGE